SMRSTGAVRAPSKPAMPPCPATASRNTEPSPDLAPWSMAREMPSDSASGNMEDHGLRGPSSGRGQGLKATELSEVRRRTLAVSTEQGQAPILDLAARSATGDRQAAVAFACMIAAMNDWGAD